MPKAPRSRPNPRGRRWLRWLALAALSVVAFTGAALVVWLGTDDFQQRAVGRLTAMIEQATGERTHIGEVRLRLWSPAVEIRDLHLYHAQTGDRIVSIDHLRAPLVLRDGGVALGQLSVIRPVVRLHHDGEQLREFQRFTPGAPMQRLPWSSLQVSDAELSLAFPDGEVGVSELHLRPDAGPHASLQGRVDLQWHGLEESIDLDLTDLTVGPEVFEIPDLVLKTDAFDLEGRLHYPLGGRISGSGRGYVELHSLNPLLEDPAALHGRVGYDAVLSGSPADPRVELSLLAIDLAVDHPSEYFERPVRHHRYGQFTGRAEVSRAGILIDQGLLQWGPGRIFIDAQLTPTLEVTEAHVRGDSISFAHIMRATEAAPTPWVEMEGQVDAEVSGTLAPLELKGPFEARALDFRVGDGPIETQGVTEQLVIPRLGARGMLDLDAQRIVLDASEIWGPRTTGEARARIGFPDRGSLDLGFSLDALDLRDLRPLNDARLVGRGTLEGRIQGPFQDLEAWAEADVTGFSVAGVPYADRLTGPIRSPDLRSLIMDDVRAQKGDTAYHGSLALDFEPELAMDLTVEVPDGRVEDVVGIFVDLPGLEGQLSGNVSLVGPLYDMDGAARLDVREVDLWGERFARGTARGFMDEGLFTLDHLRLHRDDGPHGLWLRGSVGRSWSLNMELLGDGLALENLDHLAGVDLPLSGTFSVAAHIDNTLQSPAPHGRVTVRGARYGSENVPDSQVSFHTDEGVTYVDAQLVGGTVTALAKLGLWDERPYQLDAGFQDFPIHLFYPIAADGERVRGQLSGNLSLLGTLGPEPDPIDLHAELDEVSLHWNHHHLTNPEPWRFVLQGRAFGLEGVSLRGGQTHLAFQAQGGDAPFHLDGTGRVDADLLRAVLPGLRRSQGEAELNLAVVDRDGSREALLEAHLDAPLLRHASFPAALEDVGLHLRATDSRYEVARAEASVGGGTVSAEGFLLAEQWMPQAWDLRGEAQDVQIQWLDQLPPAVGDADLRFNGPNDALLLSGDIHIDEAWFTDRIDWEESVVGWQDTLLVDTPATEEEPLFSMDLHLEAPGTLHLRNNVADGQATADLRILGDTVRPGLLGTVRIDEGYFYLQDREFRIDRGTVEFRDPWTWDPELGFELVTDIARREQSYRVRYLVSGPFSNWRTDSRSEPPLAQADINALLWFGMTADDLEDMGELPQAIGQGVVDLLLADLLAGSQTARDLRDELGGVNVDVVTGVNARGEYSPDPRLLVTRRMAGWELTGEINVVQADDHYFRGDVDIYDGWSLSLWYATRQRERSLPIGGSYGVDLRARWELD